MVAKFYVALALIILNAIVSCSPVHTNQDSAGEAVASFHGKLDEGLYQSIVVSADKEFRARAADSEAYLKGVREKAGKVKRSVRIALSVQNTTDEAQVTLSYLTQFEQAQGNESFVFRVKDGRARLMFYEVKFGGGLGPD